MATPITNPEAVDFGYLVAFAEGMYLPGSIMPGDGAKVAAAGWDIVAHLIARNSILPDMKSLGPDHPKALQLGPLVFSAISCAMAETARYAAAIRGTDGFAEWVIDADFFLRDGPSSPGAKVEQGFWSIYNSMTLVGLDGVQIGARPRTASRAWWARRL